MFIINFFLEYVLFFILLVVLTIALLSEYGKITIHRSLYLPTILLGLGLNFLFFDIDMFIQLYYYIKQLNSLVSTRIYNNNL